MFLLYGKWDIRFNNYEEAEIFDPKLNYNAVCESNLPINDMEKRREKDIKKRCEKCKYRDKYYIEYECGHTNCYDCYNNVLLSHGNTCSICGTKMKVKKSNKNIYIYDDTCSNDACSTDASSNDNIKTHPLYNEYLKITDKINTPKLNFHYSNSATILNVYNKKTVCIPIIKKYNSLNKLRTTRDKYPNYKFIRKIKCSSIEEFINIIYNDEYLYKNILYNYINADGYNVKTYDYNDLYMVKACCRKNLLYKIEEGENIFENEDYENDYIVNQKSIVNEMSAIKNNFENKYMYNNIPYQYKYHSYATKNNLKYLHKVHLDIFLRHKGGMKLDLFGKLFFFLRDEGSIILFIDKEDFEHYYFILV